MHKLIILFRSMYGYLLKWLYDMHLLRVPALGEKYQADIIVSLTSYGRRVQKGVVCYSVYSILRQTLQPQRIILWLSKTEWNDTNLSPRVAALRNKGVEIRYCENMRSYTKLLPTLFLNPKESIVTIDDDVLYSRYLIASLWSEHQEYPKEIIGTLVVQADLNRPYTDWLFASHGTQDMYYLAAGVGGVLYPEQSLQADMLDYALAAHYAPNADDVWFWAASIPIGTVKRRTRQKFSTISFDAIYQYLHQGSALQHSNVKGNVLSNDTQIAATMKYIKERYGVG